MRDGQQQRGFTLIELLIGMTIGLVILAGIVAMFLSGVNAGRSEASRADRMADLYLASQIMQTELKLARSICWNAAKRHLIYQPLESAQALGACGTVAASNGAFRFEQGKKRICWDRPSENDGCQELIRGIDRFDATQSGGVWTLRLQGSYTDADHKNKSLQVVFKVWPRNR